MRLKTWRNLLPSFRSTFWPSSVPVNKIGTTKSVSISATLIRSKHFCSPSLSDIHCHSSSTSVTRYNRPPTARVNAYSARRLCWIILRRWFAVLKCGSGNKKNSFESWPFLKKCGMCFIEFVRTQVMFSKSPRWLRRRARQRSFTYWLTLSLISMPLARVHSKKDRETGKTGNTAQTVG